jgi:hypothetical protein
MDSQSNASMSGIRPKFGSRAKTIKPTGHFKEEREIVYESPLEHYQLGVMAHRMYYLFMILAVLNTAFF